MAEYNIKVTGAEGGVVGRNYTTGVQTIMQDGSSASIQCQTANFNVEQKRPEDSNAEKIRKRTIDQFEAWNKNMARTGALGQVLERLKAGATWLTIKGNPGEGKTTVGFMALGELHKDGRHVFEVRTPEEFTDVISTRLRPVILLDDVFGDLEFNQMKWSSWEPVVSPLLKEREHKSNEEEDTTSKKDVTVILIGRDYVLNSASADLGRLSDFITSDKHVIHMDHSLERGIEEKRAIWESISQTSGVKLDDRTVYRILTVEMTHGFPHVCRLFTTMHKDSNDISVIEFFQKPLDFLNKSVEILFKDTHKVMLFKEMIKDEGKVNTKFLTKLDASYKIIQVAKDLVGSYLKCVDGCFNFDHPSIYDSVAFHLCSRDPEFAIKQCHLSFIHERIRLQLLPKDTNSDSKLVVHVDRSFADDLAKRFADEIMAKHFIQVLSHQAFTDKSFVKNVFSKVQTPLKSLLHLYNDNIWLDSHTFLHLVPSSKSSELLRYIDSCPDIKLTEDDENAILYEACKVAAFKVLLYMKNTRKSFNINERDKHHDETPLMIAAKSRNVDFVRQILSLEPDLNARTSFDATALHTAAMQGSEECVDLLLKAGAVVNVHNNKEYTPLHYAAEKGSAECVYLLLKAGAVVNVEENVKRTPLHYAARKGSEECVDLLLKAGAEVNVQNNNKYTPLHYAADGGYGECVDLFLKAGATVNVQNNFENTPLHYAAQEGYGECVDLLLKAGAAVNVQNISRDTPLHDAAQVRSAECVDLLLKADAKVNVQNDEEDTPLHDAARVRSAECVDLLLKADAKVNVQNNEEDTPLHDAARVGSAECVDLLLKAGAVVNVQNNDKDTPLHDTARVGSAECVDLLLKAGAVVNVQNNDKDTPLHDTARVGSAECVDLLLKARAVVNVQNRYGKTPLHYAIRVGSAECVDLLLKAGAIVTAQNRNGDTPLHLLCSSYNNGVVKSVGADLKKVARLLIDNGADADIHNNQGTPALHGNLKELLQEDETPKAKKTRYN